MSALDDLRKLGEFPAVERLLAYADGKWEGHYCLVLVAIEELAAALWRMKDEKDCCVDLIRDYEQAAEAGADAASAALVKAVVARAEKAEAELSELRAHQMCDVDPEQTRAGGAEAGEGG